MQALRDLLRISREVALNNRAGMWAWVLQRLTGLALTLYLIPHLIVLSSARGGAASFNRATGGIQTPIWYLFDLALLAAFLFHGCNGLRVIVVDTGNRGYAQKLWLLAMGIIGGLFMVLGTVYFVRVFLRLS